MRHVEYDPGSFRRMKTLNTGPVKELVMFKCCDSARLCGVDIDPCVFASYVSTFVPSPTNVPVRIGIGFAKQGLGFFAVTRPLRSKGVVRGRNPNAVVKFLSHLRFCHPPLSRLRTS